MKYYTLTFHCFLAVICLGGTSCDSGDNDNDNYNDDNNNDNDDDDNDNENDTELPAMKLEFVDGPRAADDCTRLVIGPDDTKYVLALRGRTLFFYSLASGEKAWSKFILAESAGRGDLAADADGVAHVS